VTETRNLAFQAINPVNVQWYAVARVEELPPGARKIITVAGKSIGLFNVGGQLRAVLNVCPHALAPVCVGRVSGTTLPSEPGEFTWARDGEILACPWHGWEFDLLSGTCLTDRRRLRLYAVEVREATVHVALKTREGVDL
jgi:nitrite reductase (NADH) small subunit